MGRFRAFPYAKALLAVVKKEEPQRAEEIADELDAVADALDAVPEFHRVMVTPMIEADRKPQILDSVLDSIGVSQLTRRFLHVVQGHYRMEHMRDIAPTNRELVDRELGRVRALVETAGELGEGDKSRLVQAISAFEGSTVVADFVANRELLGGFKVQVGSRVFDGSLDGELDRLSRQIEIEQG